ncbi:beta-L-arabinofuranosidase domain-containing protein [Flavobacteriaceae bacterium SZ-1-7]|uniref:beta-L-arabinofuranosidase domain-containing protein n=1 Tax=Tamlana sedimenti TaxID=3134126 RepID=UPI0031210DA7
MKRDKLSIYLALAFYLSSVLAVFAQSGNQILDGIGETGLIARYVFEGNLKDWSRNNLHAEIKDGSPEFIEDTLFKKALALNAGNNTYISLPGQTLNSIESLSVTGWIFFKSDADNQFVLDFGKDSSSHVSLKTTEDGTGIQSEIVSETKGVFKTVSKSLKPNAWNHVALVIDVSSETLITYINGKHAAETKLDDFELEKIFNTPNGKNELYIGKSLASNIGNLDASLYDFRLYRIPLSNSQIDNIFHNSLGQENQVNERHEENNDLQEFAEDEPQLYNQYLTRVPDIEVETVVGFLPRLPRTLDGIYINGINGPKVRVIWPAPIDNNVVLQPGKYTVSGTIVGSKIVPKAIVTVKTDSPSITPSKLLETFNLDAVSLDLDSHGHQSKFIENRDKFIKTLAETNPDDFLYMFRNAFGQKQPKGAKPLGVWDTQETKLRGHATGHYLTAIAQAYASTGYDELLHINFGNKMEHMVNTLHKLYQMSGHPREAGDNCVSDPSAVPPGPDKANYDSDLSEDGIRTDYWNWGKGFISAYPPDQFVMLEQGATYGGQKNQVWAPYYTLHKILAGLMDIYEASGNKKALEIAKGMGDWVHVRLSLLPTKTLIHMWNSYIAGEFGGMNEAMARLFRITNDSKYLETAKLFDNINVFFGDANHNHGLAKNVDTFRGLHANQHIPQIIGALEIYRDSNASEYYRIADNFWYKTVNDYMYSIGGVAGARNPANAECFISQPATLYENGFSASGQNETCATYNMLKLTRGLFLFEQSTDLMDYYERGLYNHILASVAEDSPANTYHVPLRPGSVKHFGNPDMKGFTCCNGTSLESNTMLQNSIYFKSSDNKTLYVNLFIPSTLKWTEKKVSITQTTTFPNEDYTKLTVKGKGKFNINVRVPTWASKGFFVTINGKKEKVNAKPGSYIKLSRKWKNGDTIELRMPFQFHLEPVMDQQNIASLFYGPILLASQEPEPRKEWRKLTFDVSDISKSIEGNPRTFKFTINGVVLKPFYDIYGRHSTYFDVTFK